MPGESYLIIPELRGGGQHDGIRVASYFVASQHVFGTIAAEGKPTPIIQPVGGNFQRVPEKQGVPETMIYAQHHPQQNPLDDHPDSATEY